MSFYLRLGDSPNILCFLPEHQSPQWYVGTAFGLRDRLACGRYEFATHEAADRFRRFLMVSQPEPFTKEIVVCTIEPARDEVIKTVVSPW